MLKLEILAIGKDKDAWVEEGCEHYRKLLGRYADTTITILPSVRQAAHLPSHELMAREAGAFRKYLSKGFIVALSEHGKRMNSQMLARTIDKWQVAGNGTILFVIGGAYGLEVGLVRDADFVLSLSEMTFSHQLVRVVLLEQLYRALSILKGSSYHK